MPKSHGATALRAARGVGGGGRGAQGVATARSGRSSAGSARFPASGRPGRLAGRAAPGASRWARCVPAAASWSLCNLWGRSSQRFLLEQSLCRVPGAVQRPRGPPALCDSGRGALCLCNPEASLPPARGSAVGWSAAAPRLPGTVLTACSAAPPAGPSLAKWQSGGCRKGGVLPPTPAPGAAALNPELAGRGRRREEQGGVLGGGGWAPWAQPSHRLHWALGTAPCAPCLLFLFLLGFGLVVGRGAQS